MDEDSPTWADRGLPPELDPRNPGGRRGRRRLADKHGSTLVMSSFVTPPKTRPAGRTRAVRALSFVALGLSVVMVIVFAGGYLVYRHLDSNLTRRDVFNGIISDTRPSKAPTATAALDVLLVGSDSRGGSDASFQDPGNYVGGARSDTVILAHISADRQRATLTSIPRDLLVSIPACTNPQTGTVYKALKVAQFNSAFARGDLDTGNPSCLIGTVEQLTGVKLDHYIEVDFAGFTTMVQALGGVPLCLSKPLKDTNNTVDLPAGDITLTGQEALGFVRARKGLGDGSDLQRIDRQKAFLSSMIRKATSTGMLLRPDKLLSFLNATTSAITVDSALSLGEMRAIGSSLGSLDPARVTFVTVPLDPAPGPDYDRGGKYYGRVKLDAGPAAALFTAIRDDSPLPGDTSSPAPAPSATPSPSAAPSGPTLIVAPQQVTVDVLNANGVKGAAGAAAAALGKLGFGIGKVATATTTGAATTIRYGPTRADSAQTLAAAIPGAVLEPDAALGSRLQLLVGAGFPTALTPVTLGSPSPAGSQAGSPTPTAVPSLNTVTASQDGCV